MFHSNNSFNNRKRFTDNINFYFPSSSVYCLLCTLFFLSHLFFSLFLSIYGTPCQYNRSLLFSYWLWTPFISMVFFVEIVSKLLLDTKRTLLTLSLCLSNTQCVCKSYQMTWWHWTDIISYTLDPIELCNNTTWISTWTHRVILIVRVLFNYSYHRMKKSSSCMIYAPRLLLVYAIERTIH